MLHRTLPLLVTLAACARPEGDAALPVDQAGTPGTLNMVISPIVPGGPVTFRVTGATPNRPVYFLRSSAAQLNGFCPPATAPSCLDLRAPATLQFQVTANSSGVATLTVTVPALPLASVVWQSATLVAGAFNSSNVVTSTIYQPGTDTDGDGLTALDEVSVHGTDPGIADSDGGGVSDGAEVAAGTDPTDPADDSTSSALGIDDISTGDLVITEIMKNPNAVGDGDGEWFEIYNDAGADVDLDGMVVRDNATNIHTVGSSVVVAAGDYAVLAINANPALNGGVAVDYSYQGAAFFLDNGDDEVILRNTAGVIDQVFYDAGATFPSPTGASMNLDPGSRTATANDTGGNWCATASATLPAGDKGTPGAANEICPPPPPTFVADISPLALAECSGCHTGGGSSAGFRADVYTSWLSPSTQVPSLDRVEPGDTALSYAWHKIQGTQATVGGSGLRMPRGGPPFLDAAQTALVEAWIQAGAPQN
jgi:hypothetical protein